MNIFVFHCIKASVCYETETQLKDISRYTSNPTSLAKAFSISNFLFAEKSRSLRGGPKKNIFHNTIGHHLLTHIIIT